MRTLFIVCTVIFLFCAGFGIYVWVSPEQQAKRQVRSLLEEFNEAVGTSDRAAVSAFLERYLAEDANITIKVSVSMLGVAGNTPIYQEQFDKKRFISFIDNTLYPLEQYRFKMELQDLQLSEDGASANVSTRASASASTGVGEHMQGRPINTRYILVTDCTGTAAFKNETALLQNSDCIINLHKQVDLQGASIRDLMQDVTGGHRP